jgi:lipopolysaccharide export system protein LptA
MMHRLILAAAAAALISVSAPAIAATAAKTAAPTPVNIEANEMEILDADKKAVFRGSVDAKRGDVSLKSDTLTVLYADVKQPDGTAKTDATDLDAKGNVTITTPRETITGDWAKFNPQANTLVQGSTVLTGKELYADLNTDKVEMKGGRVKGSFLPK